MKVLVACEYSGIVREAFASKGHDAWSCDLLPTDQPSNKHIQGDVLEIINNDWDLIIAHPPCTHLSVSGAARWAEKVADGRQQAAIKFVEDIWNANCPFIAIENPVGALSTRSKLGKASQYIQPYEFGHAEQKKTGLWLKGLPKLIPTDVIDVSNLPDNQRQRLHYLPPSKDRWKIRSTTFQGIADAMADQWSNVDQQVLQTNLFKVY
jgi:site-specific DNA-cytosine methylase|tara:strand:- start:17 stop:640 length:624 start_codon:yes stop_codon:yes gene_type:complete